VRRVVLVLLAALILVAGAAEAAKKKRRTSTGGKKRPAPAKVAPPADAGPLLDEAVAAEVPPADAGPPDAGPAAAPVEPETLPIPVPVPVPIERARKPAPGATLQLAPPSAPARRVRRAPTALEVITAIIGLVVIVGMAYLASHPKVQELEELLGITAVVAAGLPFVLFGLIAHSEQIGILTPAVLDYLRPFIPLGLGWIGFSIGFRFDVRRLEALPRGVGPALLLTSVLPFAAIAGACGLILLMTDGLGHATFLRDAIILGTAAIIGVRPAAPGPEGPRADRIAPLVQLQEGAAMIGLVLVAAFWRPSGQEVGWQLPAFAWIFVTLGMGTALGAVIYAVLHAFRGKTEITVLMLGSIALAAGMASFLRLSPIAVCFIAGALIFNFPGTWKEQVRLALVKLERPIYLVFLVVAGAMWEVTAWQGWVLLLLFVAGRLVGKVLGVFLSQQSRLGEQLHIELGGLNHEERVRIALAPMGALAIAIVVSAQDLYAGAPGSSSTVSWMVTTVIGGAVATEILTQLILRKLYPHDYALPVTSESPSGLAPQPREATGSFARLADTIDTSRPASAPPPLPPPRLPGVGDDPDEGWG
jgi:hypothetical protein